MIFIKLHIKGKKHKKYLFIYLFITCAPAMLRAGIVFGGVCLSLCVCLSAENLKNYRSELDVAW